MQYNSPRNNFARQIDIVDLISKKVKLEKRGANHFGCCPFHNEDTASFSVNAEKGIYKCFGCGVGGDAIQFVMSSENMNFNQAVTYLSKMYRINPKDYGLTIFQRNSEIDEIIVINNEAARFYHYNLTTSEIGKNAREYLERRGIFPNDILEFNLGYALNESDYLYKILKQKQYNEVAIDKSTLVINGARPHDFFIDRIIFPISNINNEIVGFSGRTISLDTDTPKYVNSRENIAFNKSTTLYNLHKSLPFIKEKREVIIFEGFMDLIRAWQAGIKNSVAIMGTALTKEHIEILSKYADKVILAFDGDKAGINATLKNIEVLTDNFSRIFAVKFPQGMDPDEFIVNFGYKEFHQIIKNAPSFVEYYVDNKIKNVNLTSPFEKNDFAKEIGNLILKIKDPNIEKDLAKIIEDKFLFKPELPYNKTTYWQNNWRNNEQKEEKVMIKKAKSEKDYVRELGYSEQFQLALFYHECLLMLRIIQRPSIVYEHQQLKNLQTMISSEILIKMFAKVRNEIKKNKEITSYQLEKIISEDDELYQFFVFLTTNHKLPEYFDDNEISFYLANTVEVKLLHDEINVLEKEKEKYSSATNAGLAELMKINARINQLREQIRSKQIYGQN